MELSPLKIERKPRKAPPVARSSGRPARRLPVFQLLFLGLVVGAVYVFWTPLSRFADRVRLPEVQVLRVERSHAAAVGAVEGTAANGYVVAARRAALSADTPGRVVELHVEEGSVVKAGDLVARLFDEEYLAALTRAEAELEVARRSVERADSEVEAVRAELEQLEEAVTAAEARCEADEATLQFARKELSRVANLHQRGIVNASELDRAREALDVAAAGERAGRAEAERAARAAKAGAARLAVAEKGQRVSEASVHTLEAGRDLAAATLDKTLVRAPFDGIVVLKDAEVGEVVSPNSQGGSNARGSICTMVDLDSLEVQVDVPETNLGAVRAGARASVFLDAYPSRGYPGRVSRIWPTANRQKATVEVRVTFDERDDLLRPEMGARVVFLHDEMAEAVPTEPADPQILVPESAIVRLGGSDGVFVLERDRVRFQELSLGGRGAGRVTVERGLEEGDRIVLEPPLSLEDGDRVRLAQ